MIDTSKREQRLASIEKKRERMHAVIDEENYEYTPGEKDIEITDLNVPLNVAVYARVSTGDELQTTSYELQQIYYEDFVRRHPDWTLVKIYADEGISGTSRNKRVEFNKMIDDCHAGKIDLIVTKSVSRFARDVLITMGIVRELQKMKPPVGVLFESEGILSLSSQSQMALSFLASVAEEESRIRSRSMETSLRMRLDNGIPLTPKLFGYTHDTDGNLVVNPVEAPTVKLVFYMYLYGYSTQQIADALTALGKKTYYGLAKWTSSGIVQILRNERHCGDVHTRKTFTLDFHDHKKYKNTGQRPRSLYKNHHEAIIKRDDFIAVQKLLDNARYRNNPFLPELRVIDKGILKGFVVINPRWAAFKEEDYYKASQSSYGSDDNPADQCFPAYKVNIYAAFCLSDSTDTSSRLLVVCIAEIQRIIHCHAACCERQSHTCRLKLPDKYTHIIVRLEHFNLLGSVFYIAFYKGVTDFLLCKHFCDGVYLWNKPCKHHDLFACLDAFVYDILQRLQLCSADLLHDTVYIILDESAGTLRQTE